MKLICLCEIVGAHGIKGQVKIKTHTQSPEAIATYGTLYSKNMQTEIKIKSVKPLNSNTLIAVLEGVQDRTHAETLVGTKLYVERTQLPAESDGEYYHEDLVGLNVQDTSDKTYGVVLGLQDFGAGVFLDIKKSENTKIATIPFTKDAVLSIDIENSTLVIDPDFLLE